MGKSGGHKMFADTLARTRHIAYVVSPGNPINCSTAFPFLILHNVQFCKTLLIRFPGLTIYAICLVLASVSANILCPPDSCEDCTMSSANLEFEDVIGSSCWPDTASRAVFDILPEVT